MKKNDKMNVEPKKDTNKVTILFSVISLTILLMIELYIMINDSQNYVNLLIVAVIMLILVYLLVTAIMQHNYKKTMKSDEQYENIFKSEKASYLLLRKYFTEIEERLDKLEKNATVPKDEIISIQKAIAKVSISRNKENADALMNSNDKLMEKIYELENISDKANDKLLERQKAMIENANKEVLIKQQELETAIKNTELSVCKEIIKSLGSMQIGTTVIKQQDEKQGEVHNESSIEKTNEQELDEMLSAVTEDKAEASTEVLDEEPIEVQSDIFLEKEDENELDENDVQSDVSEEAEIELDENITETPEEEVIKEQEPASDPNKMMTPEDIAALLANTNKEETVKDPEVEDKIVETPEEVTKEQEPASDPNKMMTPEDIAALLASNTAEEIPIQEETAEIVPEMPNETETQVKEPASDLNKMMTPEDIAALLASTAAEEKTTDAEPEVPEPEPQEKPVETAPDPNRKMTPEEIAALFANA